jgi:transcriptional regulator with XRE-family HTH domain
MAVAGIGMKHNNTALGERIRQVRKTMGLTQQEFAQRLDVTQPTVHRWEKGSYDPDEQALRRLGVMSKLSPAYLRYGDEAFSDRSPKTDLAGFIGANGEVLLAQDRQAPPACQAVEPPSAERRQMLCLLVRDEGLQPAYRAGDVIFYAREINTDERDFLDRECVVKITRGAILLKRVVAGSRPGRYTLLSHNASPISDSGLDWAAPVQWVRRA